MASAKEKRIVKGIFHNLAESKSSDIYTDLALKLGKTKVELVNVTIILDAKFKDKDKVKYESKSVNVFRI